MERIASLIEQLQQALERKASAGQMLLLTNMLQTELQNLVQQKTENISTLRVAVLMPAAKIDLTAFQPETLTTQQAHPSPTETAEKILEVLQVNEEEIEAELEEIRKKAEFVKKMQAQQQQHKPVLLFEDEPEIPTLIHQPTYKAQAHQNGSKEVNEAITGEGPSIHDQLIEQKTETGHKFAASNSIKDLKKAIGINDRFVFINELFRGDEAMYERSIKTINSFSIYAEAQYWMERELKIKLGWDNESLATQEFYVLVKRRFS